MYGCTERAAPLDPVYGNDYPPNDIIISRWVARMYMPLPRFCVPPVPSELLESFRKYAQDRMVKYSWAQAVLALSSIACAQDSSSVPPADGLTTSAYGTSTGSVGTATVGGATSTYSVQFTIPAAVDVGPNLLPNVKDPNAKQAQQLCPGYQASNVMHTANGFTATLNLAGEAVSSDTNFSILCS